MFQSRWTMLTMVILLSGGGVTAAVVWSANYNGLDLTQWQMLDCGGNGGTCACLADPSFPPPVGPSTCSGNVCSAINYGPGRCNASTHTHSSDALPNPLDPGATGRLQFVPDPTVGLTGSVLRVKVARGDAFFDCDSATTRVELSNSSNPGVYLLGNDYYFAVSMFFRSGYFGAYTCNSDNLPTDQYNRNQCPNPAGVEYDQLQNHGGCSSGVVGTDPQYGAYSAWNVVTQWHARGFPSMGFTLQRLYEDTTHNYYQLNFNSMYTGVSGHSAGGIWHDAGDPSKGGAIWTDRWYHFVIHVVFGATIYPGSGSPANDPANGNVNGVVELWESIDSVPGHTNLLQQAFNGTHKDGDPGTTTYLPASCYPGSPSTKCYTDTMDPSDTSWVVLKQGLYRNPTLADPPTASCPLPLDNGVCPTAMYYKDTSFGNTLADVAPAILCDSISCASGCCSANQCVTSQSNSVCGTNGAACAACSSGWTCQNNSCQCAPSTTPCGSQCCNSGQTCSGGSCVASCRVNCACGCNTSQTGCRVGLCPKGMIWDDVTCMCTTSPAP